MKKIGIRKLYIEDPIKADEVLWGRKSNDIGRRGFLSRSALFSIELALGAKLVFSKNFPEGLIPAGLLDSEEEFQIPGKSDQLIILNDRPLNAETPPHLLDAAQTTSDLFFVRNNGIPPERSEISTSTWKIEVSGESVVKIKSYTLNELKSKFKVVKKCLTLECAGNGRNEFFPEADGNQWALGAVGCAEFEGVRLKDVLNDVGIKSNAIYVAYEGADRHLSGDPAKKSISRGVPISKALEEESMIAWNMNGAALPLHNGYPLRLVFGGWPASCSGKWLTKILVRNKVHDGEKMTGSSYRLPCESVAPGEKVSDDSMCIIESMPVKSLITYPKSGLMIKLGQKLDLRGHAWAGDDRVKEVAYSIDFGQTWTACTLSPPVNRLAWQRFTANISFPKKGYYEVWAKATDSQGISQPMIVPGWNPKGYLNNACHRIAVKLV